MSQTYKEYIAGYYEGMETASNHSCDFMNDGWWKLNGTRTPADDAPKKTACYMNNHASRVPGVVDKIKSCVPGGDLSQPVDFDSSSYNSFENCTQSKLADGNDKCTFKNGKCQDANKVPLWAIIAAAAGGFVVIIIIMYLLLRRHRSNAPSVIYMPPPSQSSVTPTAYSGYSEYYSG